MILLQVLEVVTADFVAGRNLHLHQMHNNALIQQCASQQISSLYDHLVGAASAQCRLSPEATESLRRAK
jgi:hypothetical protein